MLIGDFDWPDISWSHLIPNSCDSNNIFDIWFFCELKQVSRDFTRVRGDSHSIMCLIFLSNVFTECNVSIESGSFNHNLVYLECLVTRQQLNNTMKA